MCISHLRPVSCTSHGFARARFNSTQSRVTTNWLDMGCSSVIFFSQPSEFVAGLGWSVRIANGTEREGPLIICSHVAKRCWSCNIC